MVREEYPHLLDEKNIKLKISGCMNSCGQHMVASIGLHGSSIKKGDKVIPAMQVVIGGGVNHDGQGYIAEKVIKLPTKRIPDAVRSLLDDYESNSGEGEYFNQYFRRLGKVYFYDLLKSLGDTSKLSEEDYQDWGKEIDFVPEIGVGECAGVVLDLVGTILMDAEDRLNNARKAFVDQKWANAAYFGYNTLVIAAKAILLSEEISCNTHKGIIDDFQRHFVESGKIKLEGSFQDLVLQINEHQPTEAFAYEYLEQAQRFLKLVVDYRKGIVQEEKMGYSKLTLVGAGPGDPDLITLKGIKALQKADVVLYDALVHPDLLQHAPMAEHIPVGKRAGKASVSQDTINQLIVEKALKKGHVVRLKGGDPFVFARGFEELQVAAKFGIETDVVVGISSLQLPGLYGIPLTCRGVNQSFTVLTATTSRGDLSDEVINAAKYAPTAIIFMGFRKLKQIVNHYEQAGRKDLPVAIVAQGSLNSAAVVQATVSSIVEIVEQSDIPMPALLIFGEGAQYGLLKNDPRAKVKIIAPTILDEIKNLAAEHDGIKLIFREVLFWDLAEIDLLILATNDQKLHTRLRKKAREKQILVNVADTPDLCDFYLGSTVKKGNLKIGISTNGKSPTFAKRFRQMLEEVLPDETDDLLQNLRSIRDQLKGNFSYKVKELNKITKTLMENDARISS
ncbi:cobA [Symbiodinium microadriaticum]|nr:cobA [Symbiodinium microadriaticum]